MNEVETTQNVSLTTVEGGAIRVTGTRVNLDTIVYQFNVGASAETIVDRFPSLKLADVYTVIAYYLNHLEEVEAYLRRRKQEVAAVRVEIEAGQEDRKLLCAIGLKRCI